jgi:hypothetical protein
MIELETLQRLNRRVRTFERRLRSRSALVVSSVLLAALACCTRTPAISTPANTLNVVVHLPARGDSQPIPDAVAIDIDVSAGLDYRSTTVSTPNGGSRVEVTLNGKRFEVVGGELHLGEDRYGPLRVGMLLRITTEGVYIDGKKAEPRR